MAITNLIATFDSSALTSIAGVSVLGTDPYAPPKRTLSQYLLARTDKRKTNSAFYTEKKVTVRVGISRITRDVAEQSLDALLTLLQGINKELVISQAGGVRKYYCTLSDSVILRGGGAYIELNLIFSCDESFGYDTGYTQALNLTNITTSTRGDALPFGGSAPWQVPLIVITYSAMTGSTSKSVIIGNSATAAQITITRTWAAGDRLEIDCFNRTVKVNGSDVAFTGGFPEFAPQLGNWSYSDQFTTRTFSALITYYKRYI